MAIRKVCCCAGCDELAVDGGSHCAEHEADRLAKAAKRKAEGKMGKEARVGAALYKTAEWRTGRLQHLQRHPLCVDCAELGAVVEATEVDHIEPHRGDRRKFFRRSNWQSLCKSCHSRKTAREVLPTGGHPKI